MASVEEILAQFIIHDNGVEFSPAIKTYAISDSLSPSGVADFESGCTSKKLVERALQKADDTVPDPTSPAYIGTATHSVLERLMQMKPEDRVMANIDPIYRECVADQIIQLPDDANAAEVFTQKVHELAAGLFGIERPNEIDVISAEKAFSLKLWGVPLRGVIDRVDRLADGTLAVIDYKTGKYRKPNPKFGDNYTPQLVLYALAMESIYKTPVTKAYDFFVAEGKIHEVVITDELVASVKESVLNAWEVVQRLQKTRRGTYKTSGLCGWCPLAAHCPAAKLEGKEAKSPLAQQMAKHKIPVDERVANAKPVYVEDRKWKTHVGVGQTNLGSTYAESVSLVVSEAVTVIANAYSEPDNLVLVREMSKVLLLLVTGIASTYARADVEPSHALWRQAYWTLIRWKAKNHVNTDDVKGWAQTALDECVELMRTSLEIEDIEDDNDIANLG
jgi:RecB family exonuclease